MTAALIIVAIVAIAFAVSNITKTEMPRMTTWIVALFLIALVLFDAWQPGVFRH